MALTFLALEFTKHKHTLRISNTIVLPRRNVPVVRIGLLYSAYYLLTGCEGSSVEYLARGFEVRTELARSVRKKTRA